MNTCIPLKTLVLKTCGIIIVAQYKTEKVNLPKVHSKSMCTKFSIACHFFSLELRGSIFCTPIDTITRHILGYIRIKFLIDKVAKFDVKILTPQEGMLFIS